jgi:hypothetical protein
MKLRTIRSLLLVASALSLMALVLTIHASNSPSPSSPGMSTYSPTRLEWLEMELQANYRFEDNNDPEIDYSTNFFAKTPDTIVVLVQYSNHTPAKIVDRAAEHNKRIAEKVVSSHGWTSWAKIEVQRELTDTTKQ